MEMKRTSQRRFKLKPPPSVNSNAEGASCPVIPVWPAGEVSGRPRWLQGLPNWLEPELLDETYHRIYKAIVHEPGSSWSSRIMTALSTRVITQLVIAKAVAIRRGCPARHPSPQKSPGPRIATTASFPCSEWATIFT